MIIEAKYDQTITKAIRNSEGDVIAHSPTTHHYTFGKTGDDICGGFYVKSKNDLPEIITLRTDKTTVTAIIPPLELKIKTK
jgi:hypothetical protein